MNQTNNMLKKFINLILNNSDNDDNDDNDTVDKDLILLVSRNVENQLALKEIITQANYNFIKTKSLQIAQTYDFKRNYGVPDLIILDLDKQPNSFDLWSLKISNNVPVIRFVDRQKFQASEKSVTPQPNSYKSSINASKNTEMTVDLFVSNDVLIERPVSSAKLLILIAECLNKNTTSIIKS